ncbi:myotrophin-like [Haliotis rubra]|uniref:myotrophin-like n=1 Tax=Haliotis rubra TaxID=36100 RepID=UPI001EE5EEF0|nr:myotrophin-like [Haliotis rubra]
MADESDLSKSFLWSVKNGEVAEVRNLLAKEKSLITKAIAGRSPIHFAADYGQNEVVELLVDNGAGIDVEDQYGITPLLSAIFEGHKDTVALLLKKGAKKNGTSPDGKTYLECAETDEIKSLLSNP